MLKIIRNENSNKISSGTINKEIFIIVV